MSLFDKKFGKTFLAATPTCPGVYTFRDGEGVIVYVGKAKNLRRRLSQYRNAKRVRKHRKMRSILQTAQSLEFEILDTELNAFLREARLIQTLRPRWNIAGAYSFLYPMIGMQRSGSELHFCLTTLPDLFPGFEFFGAFRSREITGSAFFALMKLFKFVGHSIPRKRLGDSKDYSYQFGFRRLPEEWLALWGTFFRGHSTEALEVLALRLVDNAGARATASEVEESLKEVKRFFRREAKFLAKVITLTGWTQYPIPQSERDPLLLTYKMRGTLAKS